jgi:hypothetical protein
MNMYNILFDFKWRFQLNFNSGPFFRIMHSLIIKIKQNKIVSIINYSKLLKLEFSSKIIIVDSQNGS